MHSSTNSEIQLIDETKNQLESQSLVKSDESAMHGNKNMRNLNHALVADCSYHWIDRPLSIPLVLLLSCALHGVLWKWFPRDQLNAEPVIPPKPLQVMMVTMTTPEQQTSQQPEVAPPPPPPPEPIVQKKPEKVVKKEVIKKKAVKKLPQKKPQPKPKPVEYKPRVVAKTLSPVKHSSPSPVVSNVTKPSKVTSTAPVTKNAPLVEAHVGANYMYNPKPEYPAIAKRHGWEGRVLVNAHVLASGHCDQVALRRSSGHNMLDQSALRAVRNWRFVPAKRGGAAVVSWVTVPITFKIRG